MEGNGGVDHGQPIDQAARMEVIRMCEAHLGHRELFGPAQRIRNLPPVGRPRLLAGDERSSPSPAEPHSPARRHQGARQPAPAAPGLSPSASTGHEPRRQGRWAPATRARRPRGSRRRRRPTHKQTIMIDNQELALLRDHGSLGFGSVIQDKCQIETGPRSGFSGGEPRGTEQRE